MGNGRTDRNAMTCEYYLRVICLMVYKFDKCNTPHFYVYTTFIFFRKMTQNAEYKRATLQKQKATNTYVL